MDYVNSDTIPTFEKMAAVLRMGRPASDYKYLDQIQAQQHRQMMAPPPRNQPRQKIGRNDPCPCGSGKKFKQCCGKKGWGRQGIFYRRDAEDAELRERRIF